MKEIVIISGKGGTGKTSLTASFAVLGGSDIIAADCDVDAADMHLLLQPDQAESEDFFSGELAQIDPEICEQCGLCKDVCRYDAIRIVNGKHRVEPLDCEGCGYCARICPVNAITNLENNVGLLYRSRIRTGSKMVHARMKVGAENSGKLVARVKKEAKIIAENEKKDLVIVDGSPGVGCPVVSSLSGANYIVFVTEPTVSGLHDLERVHELVDRFSIPSGCIINKADLNEGKRLKIENFLKNKGINHIADIPYDENFTKSMMQGKTIVEFDNSQLKSILENSWEQIKEYAKQTK
ncbi:MAG: ATP-binding protein [Candidatus Marinimicrobia bacterium]|nr:ATP-binding protein [Candidatus Neomarinimicrobiota bacterium]